MYHLLCVTQGKGINGGGESSKVPKVKTSDVVAG